MIAWEFLISLHEVCKFTSRERKGIASNSELKRWCLNKAVTVNGTTIGPFDEMPERIDSFVLFTKKKKVTLW